MSRAISPGTAPNLRRRTGLHCLGCVSVIVLCATAHDGRAREGSGKSPWPEAEHI
jgi:hypothetical protein